MNTSRPLFVCKRIVRRCAFNKNSGIQSSVGNWQTKDYNVARNGRATITFRCCPFQFHWVPWLTDDRDDSWIGRFIWSVQACIIAIITQHKSTVMGQLCLTAVFYIYFSPPGLRRSRRWAMCFARVFIYILVISVRPIISQHPPDRSLWNSQLW